MDEKDLRDNFAYFEAPRSPTIEYRIGRRSVFLAGGITGCRDWQQEAAETLISRLPDDVLVLNPRRQDFDTSDPTASEKQIAWEYKQLERADIILFWFTNQTIQPIVLFELGRWSAQSSDKPIVVGVEPCYQREQDVRIQMDLALPGQMVWSSLTETLDDVCHMIKHWSDVCGPR